MALQGHVPIQWALPGGPFWPAAEDVPVTEAISFSEEVQGPAHALGDMCGPLPVPPSAGGSPLGGSSSGRKPSSPVDIGASGRKLDLL